MRRRVQPKQRRELIAHRIRSCGTSKRDRIGILDSLSPTRKSYGCALTWEEACLDHPKKPTASCKPGEVGDYALQRRYDTPQDHTS